MMRAPDLAAVHAAELRFAQSREQTRDGVRRVRAAVRATLAKPSTLALVGGAAVLSGFLIARRKRQQDTSPSEGSSVAPAAATSTAGVVLAFAVRYAMQHLPSLIRQFWAARQERAASTGAEPSESPPPVVRSPAGALH